MKLVKAKYTHSTVIVNETAPLLLGVCSSSCS